MQRNGLDWNIGFGRTALWTKWGDWKAAAQAKIKFWISDATRLGSNWASIKDQISREWSKKKCAIRASYSGGWQKFTRCST